MRNIVRWVLGKLYVPGPSLRNYVLRVWAIQFLPALPLAYLGSMLAEAAGDYRDMSSGPISHLSAGMLVVGVGVIDPAIETLCLWAVIAVIGLFARRALTIAALTGAIFGLLHALLNDTANGFSATWSFFCMTAAFQVGARVSTARGLMLAFAIHALHNTLIALLVIFGKWLETSGG